MSKIDKNNYEAYLLDFMEGNLSAEEQHDLFVFLAEHPELKTAFEGDFGDVVLQPQTMTFENKENLKVGDDQLSLQNVDTWMIESVEGNLTKGQEKELADFVKKHALEKTLLTYQSTRLQADTNIVYANKRGLKVETGIVIPLYLRLTAAAAAVLFIGLAIGNNWFGGTATPAVTGVAELSALKFESSAEGGTPLVIPGDQQPAVNIAESGHAPADLRNGNVVITPQLQDQFVQQDQGDIKNDSAKTVVPGEGIVDDNIVDNNNEPDGQAPAEDENDDVAINEERTLTPAFKSEQPYKLITDVASNVIKKDVYFSRQKDLASNEYVSYSFGVGQFQFERKKAK